MFKRHFFIFLLPLLVLTTGCGPEEPTSSSMSMPLTGDYGEIFFSWEQPLEGREDESISPFHVSARFVRIRDLGRRDVRSLWGEKLPGVSGAWNECAMTEATAEPLRDHLLEGSLELLDAGELSLRLPGEDVQVPSWSFPSVYGVVAGVLYGGEDVAIDFLPETEYYLVGSGSEEIGPFELRMAAPEEFEGLAVSGVDVGLDSVVLEDVQPIEVRWEPAREDNEIILELSYHQFGTEQQHIVCRSEDDGFEELPTSMVRRMWDPGVSDANLTIHRVVRRAFDAEGLDDGEAVFVISATIPISF